MNVYYDFDFIDEENIDQDIVIKDIVIKKEDISIVLSAIDTVIQWIPTSLYRSCFKGVYLTLSDCPVESMEFVDIDPYSQQIYIHLNVLSMIADYHHRPIYRKVIFKEKESTIDLRTYVQFFFLHELGHIVDACLNSPNHLHLLDKFEANALKYIPYHMQLDHKFGIDKGKRLTERERYRLEKEYRLIPSEKRADTFAFQILKHWEE